MRSALVIVIGLLVLAGCRKEDAAAMAKLDAPLRLKLEQLSRSGQHETLSVLGKCSRVIDDAMKHAIAEAGATILSANGDIFTAQVPSERVIGLAQLDFVTQLQLSQTTQPSSP